MPWMRDRSIRAPAEPLCQEAESIRDLSKSKYAQPKQVGKAERFADLAKNYQKGNDCRMRARGRKENGG